MTLKVRIKPRLPTRVTATNGMSATVSGGVLALASDYGSLAVDSSISSAQRDTVFFKYYDTAGGPSYGRISAGTLLSMVTGFGTFADNVFTLQDNSDATKQLQFQLSSIATATTRTWTVPDFSDTLVGRDSAQTMLLKTLTSPAINTPTIIGGTATALTGLGIRSTGTGAFDFTIANSENLTAGRTLTVKLNDVARTLDMGGNITTAAAFTMSGAHAFTGTLTAPTTVTFPTTGTLATLAGAETLAAKTLTAPKIATGGFLADANGNELLIFTTTASAVNELTFANGSTGVNPKWTASGETNVGIDFQAKGTGVYNFLSTASQATELRLYEDTDDGAHYTAIKAKAQAGNVNFILPADDGGANQFLKTDGSGDLSWDTPSGAGDVVGPASATDLAVARFDSTTGKLLQDSPLLSADTTGALSRSGGGGIPVQGSNTNTTVAVGDVGQVLTSTLVRASATANTNGVAKTITSIDLTAGNWLLTGSIGFEPASGTIYNVLQGGAHTTTNVLPTLLEDQFIVQTTFTATTTQVQTFPPRYIQVASGASPTTYFLVGSANFSVSTSALWGRITAIRLP